MADKTRYPQIPGTVWWGIRAILNKTPNATIDERLLGIQLSVQEVAAKQYISELIAVGILNEENKATPLANKWRLESSYKEAVDALMAKAYPQSLRDVAPHGEGDRQKAIAWFQQEGLGEGAAKNKASTYFLLGTENPNEAPPRAASGRQPSGEAAIRSSKGASVAKATKLSVANKPAREAGRGGGGMDTMPLNVNVQIHISADAGTEQIEAIFSAMRRYLHDKPAT